MKNFTGHRWWEQKNPACRKACFNKPYRITIEHYDEVVSVQKNRSDISLEEFGEMLYNISIAAGWGEKNLKEIFIH